MSWNALTLDAKIHCALGLENGPVSPPMTYLPCSCRGRVDKAFGVKRVQTKVQFLILEKSTN